MPLTFPRRVPSEDFRAFDAAHVVSLLIDTVSQRIIATVAYGTVVNGAFVANKNVPTKQYTLDGAVFTRIAQRVPNVPTGTQNLYDIIKTTIWNELIALGAESGTVV